MCGYGTEYLTNYQQIGYVSEAFTRKDLIRFLFNLSKAVKKLHQLGICHNDLHDYNILYSLENGIDYLKIIDLDHCAVIGERNYTYSSPLQDIYMICMRLYLLLCDETKTSDFDSKRNLGLPKDILEYLYFYYEDREFPDYSKTPSIYPHEWLPEFEEYEYSKEAGLYLQKGI